MKKLILITILILAASIRLADLGSKPAGLLLDEASIAFVAWLSAETGRDEAGGGILSYPRSTWNPKHPVYFYPSMLSTRMFGLNERAARLPSVVFGLLAVIGTYLLVIELFKDEALALVASLLMAVSPWHVFYSRLAIEAPSLPAVFTFGLLLLLKGFRRPLMLIPGAILMGLCFYSYPVSLLFVPLFLIGFLLIHRAEAARMKGFALAAAIIVAVMIAPFAAGMSRTTGLSGYFSSSSITTGIYRLKVETHLASKHDPAHRFIASHPAAVTAYAFATNYVGYLSPSYLFLRGDNHSPVQGTGRFGVMLLTSLPFFLLGIVMLIRNRDRSSLLLLWWLAMFPVGASLMTWGNQHSIRSIVALPCIEIISAVGIIHTVRFAAKQSHFAAAAAAIICLLLFGTNSALFLKHYFGEYSKSSSSSFNYGFRQAFDAMRSERGAIKSMIVSDRIPYVYTYVLFYNPPTPDHVHRHGNTGALDVKATLRAVGFNLCDIRFCIEKSELPALVLGRPAQLPDGFYTKRSTAGRFNISTFSLIQYEEMSPVIKLALARNVIRKPD